MKKLSYMLLSRRERQIMDAVYKRGKATAAEVLEDLADPPSYSAVRAKLKILEDKGFLEHESDGPRYVYFPVMRRESAQNTAMRHMMQTFFDDSLEKAMTALIDMRQIKLTEAEKTRLLRLIDQASEKPEQK